MVVCAAADSNINTAVVPTTLDNADCRQKVETSTATATASSVSTDLGPLNLSHDGSCASREDRSA